MSISLLLEKPALTAWWWETFSQKPLDDRNGMWLDTYMQNSEVTSKIRKAQDVGQNRYRLTFTDGTTVSVPEAEVWMFYEVHGFPVEGVSR